MTLKAGINSLIFFVDVLFEQDLRENLYCNKWLLSENFTFKYMFSDTVRKGIIDINSFNGTEELAMLGSMSALSGTGIWLIVASFFKLPVSGTHSVVGATMGYALVAHGLSGVKWKTFGMIGKK